MKLFTRDHPRLCLMAGLILCGLKWPFNWISGQDGARKAAMQSTAFGLLDPDPRMVDAWDRIEDKAPDNRGRKGLVTLSHDLTNLAIEWTRRWTPYATKFIASFAVYLTLLLIGAAIFLPMI